MVVTGTGTGILNSEGGGCYRYCTGTLVIAAKVRAVTPSSPFGPASGDIAAPVAEFRNAAISHRPSDTRIGADIHEHSSDFGHGVDPARPPVVGRRENVSYGHRCWIG